MEKQETPPFLSFEKSWKSMVIKKGRGKLLISRGYSKKNNKPTTKKPKTKTQQNRNKNKQTKPQNNSQKKPHQSQTRIYKYEAA